MIFWFLYFVCNLMLLGFLVEDWDLKGWTAVVVLFFGVPLVVGFVLLGILSGIVLGFLDILVDVVVALERGIRVIVNGDV